MKTRWSQIGSIGFLQYLVESGKVIEIIRAQSEHNLYLSVVKKEPSSVLLPHPFSA